MRRPMLPLLLLLALTAALPGRAQQAPPDLREDSLTLTTKDGVILQGVVVVPVGRPGRVPLVVLLHDWTRDRDTMAFATDELVGRGLACLVLDMRGHGKSARTATNALYYYKARPPEDMHLVVEDVALALDALRARGDVDTTRVGLLGVGNAALIAAEAGARFPWAKALALVDPAAPVAGFQPERDLGLFGNRPVLFITSASPDLRQWGETLAGFGTGPREVWPGETFNSLAALLQPGMPSLALAGEWFERHLAPRGAPPAPAGGAPPRRPAPGAR